MIKKITIKTVVAVLCAFCMLVIYQNASKLYGSEAEADLKTQKAADQQIDDAAKAVHNLFRSLREGVEQIEADAIELLEASSCDQHRLNSACSESPQVALSPAYHGSFFDYDNKNKEKRLFSSLISHAQKTHFYQVGVAFNGSGAGKLGTAAVGLQKAEGDYCFNQSYGDQRWALLTPGLLGIETGESSDSRVQKEGAFKSFVMNLSASDTSIATATQIRLVGKYRINPSFREYLNGEGIRVGVKEALFRKANSWWSDTHSESFPHSANKAKLKNGLTHLKEETAHIATWTTLRIEWKPDLTNQNDNADDSSLSPIPQHCAAYPEEEGKEVESAWLGAGITYAPEGICAVRYDNQCDVDYYDHTSDSPELEEKTAWYQNALKNRGWQPAYYGADAKKWLAEYSLPLVANDEIQGVAYGNISLMKARDVLASLPLGAKGYAVLIGLRNNILSHPVKENLTLNVSHVDDPVLKGVLAELIQQEGNSAHYQHQKDSSTNAVEGNSGHGQFITLTLKDNDGTPYIKRVYVGSHKILPPEQALNVNLPLNNVEQKANNFIRLILILDPSDFEQNVWEIRRSWLALITAVFVLMGGISFIALGGVGRSATHLSWFAGSISVLALIALGLIWRVVYLYGSEPMEQRFASQSLGERAACYKAQIDNLHRDTVLAKSYIERSKDCTTNVNAPEDFVPVYSEEEALAYLSVFAEDGREFGPHRDRLKMRMFIQSLEFTSANNVSLTGYVWTTFPSRFKDKNVKELTPVFPEAESVEFSDAMSKVDDEGNIHVRWYFSTSLRQTFDYRKYPFDRENVWVRLWPNDLYENTVLIPEFSAYSSTLPWNTPGIEEDIVLDGWQLTDSHFSYKKNNYNTTLDIIGANSADIPELYFNVGLARLFVDPFVADMLPIVVVCLLVFAVLLITTVKAGEVDLKGFSSANVLSYCAALYFVLIVSHVHLRETLNAFGIIYLEIFYFCMYFIILLVSANSLAITNEKTPEFLRKNDNFIARLSYFPLITLTLLVATIWMFY